MRYPCWNTPTVHGGWPGDPGHWHCYTLPRSRRDVQGYSKDSRGIHQAMVDSAFMQSIIHLNLVQPGALVEASSMDEQENKLPNHWYQKATRKLFSRWLIITQWLGTWGDKTLDQISPNLLAQYSRSCAAPKCKLVNQPAIPRPPLHQLPLMKVSFEWIGMDLIGLFHR